MSDAEPLTHQHQIDVMTGARERRACTLDRWAKDAGIQEFLRQPVSAELPPHIALDVAAHGVVMLIIRKPQPEPQPVAQVWTPKTKGEECPF